MQSTQFLGVARAIVIAITLGLFATPAFADPATINAVIVKWCADNSGPYKTDIAYSHRRDTPPVPVPPQIDPPCLQCGAPSNTTTDADTAANQFVATTEQPEVPMAKELMGIGRALLLLGSPSDYATSYNAASVKCLSAFDINQIYDAVPQLLRRLYDKKVYPMGNAYDKDSTRAYAGIKLILDTATAMELTNGLPTTGSIANRIPDYATITAPVLVWLQGEIDQGNTKIFGGHQYNLCPGFASLTRQILTVAGSTPVATMSSQQLAALIVKLDSFLKFKIQLDLDAGGTSDDGSKFSFTWHVAPEARRYQRLFPTRDPAGRKSTGHPQKLADGRQERRSRRLHQCQTIQSPD